MSEEPWHFLIIALFIFFQGASLKRNLTDSGPSGIARLKIVLIGRWSDPCWVLWIWQHIIASASLAVESIRLMVNSSSLCLLATVPEGRRLIKKRFSIMSKMGLASPLLLSLTAVLPQSVSCLLKSPAMINLSYGNLTFASATASEIYYIANCKAPWSAH